MHARTRRATGFTLLEMLVTLVIVAMLAAVLGQGMQQVARVEERLQASGADSQLNMIRREWLRSLIEASLPEQLNAKPQFHGDATGFTFASSEALNVKGSIGGVLHLSLRRDTGRNTGAVILATALSSDDQAATPALLSWRGPLGSIKYLDMKGQWHEQWPLPNDLLLPLPPRAVLLELGPEAGGPLLVAIPNAEIPRKRLLEWERQ